MGTRLYVGNLPFSADEDQVSDLFSQNGRTVKFEFAGRVLTVNEARERSNQGDRNRRF